MTLYEDMLKEHGTAAGALDALLAAFQLRREAAMQLAVLAAKAEAQTTQKEDADAADTA